MTDDDLPPILNCPKCPRRLRLMRYDEERLPYYVCAEHGSFHVVLEPEPPAITPANHVQVPPPIDGEQAFPSAAERTCHVCGGQFAVQGLGGVGGVHLTYLCATHRLLLRDDGEQVFWVGQPK